MSQVRWSCLYVKSGGDDPKSNVVLIYSDKQIGIPGSGNHHPYYPGMGDDLDDILPVDFLEGCMDLTVVLPTKRMVKMSIERRSVPLILSLRMLTRPSCPGLL